MFAKNKIISLLILLHAHGLGRVGREKLLQQFGTPEEAVQQGWNSIQRTLFGKWEVGGWEKDLERAEKEGVSLIPYDSPLYTKNLLKIPNFPLLLYVKGELHPQDECAAALIGTRGSTLYGKQMGEKIAKELAEGGVCVVSGLARGIDTAAHCGALEGRGRTLAVIGSGLSKLYPHENLTLSEKIAVQGAVISEFPMETAPAKGLFPQRNRIVSALSQCVCLIESPAKGGAMITMEIAEGQGKKLFALPGRVDFETFAGNHALIKDNRAQLLESGGDLLKFFNRSFPQKNVTPSLQLNFDEHRVLASLGAQEKSIHELVLLTQFPVMQLNVLLTRLVLKKVVKEFPGKLYKKIL